MNHCSLAPLEAFDVDDNDRMEPREDPDEAKRQKRMQRNRESAATSRERKRKYIAYLEEQVCQLERTVDVLQTENSFWRSLGVETYDETCPLVACAGFVT